MTQQRVSPITVTSVLPAVPVLSLQAALGQSANLTEWKNSSGTTIAYLDASGNFILNAATNQTLGWNLSNFQRNATTGFVTLVLQNFSGAGFGITAGNAGANPLIVKGAASQTADLQQWQNSAGTVLAKIKSGGDMLVNSIQDPTSVGPYILFTANNAIVLNTATNKVNFIVRAFSGQTANLQEWQDSAGAVLAKVDASGFGTFGNLVVTSSTIPANGIYLPTANTLGFATNSAFRFSINSSGGIGIASLGYGTVSLAIEKNITGGTAAWSIYQTPTVQSDVTSQAYVYHSAPSTAAASFTLSNLYHYSAQGNTVGVGSTITNQFGYIVQASMTGATANYGFYGNLAASGSARWNAYMNGTAPNYFAGQTTVGSTSLTLGSSSAAQQFGVVPTAATNVGIVVRGAASQTGNLQEWQDSAGTIVASITSAGTGRFPQIAATTSGKAFMNTAGTSNALQINTNATTNIGLIVQGVASQTANLQEWQESGGQIRAYIMPGGYLRVRTSDTSSASIVVGPASTSQVPLIVEGIASQTGNLQNWRNSSGTILAKVDATGNFVVGDMAIATSSVATIHISNGTIPSANPTGGGVLYVEGGALKYRGSSGTITTVANA